MFNFQQPLWLLALLLVPAYLWFEIKLRKDKRHSFAFSRLDVLLQLKPSSFLQKHLHLILRAALILFLVIAIARPRWGKARQDVEGEGVDIVIALDVSGSMLAMDFVPENRLGAAKKVAEEFIRNRENDRIGLVSFSEYALTRCPLTNDHGALINQLEMMQVNREASATAIGMGIAAAVARLRNSTAKSRVIILITDGVNNTGEIDPDAAAELSKTFGIRIYPIGVGSNVPVDFPVSDPIFGTRYQKVLIEMDINTLNRIAAITGTGTAALATNEEQMKAILGKINALEKSHYKIRKFYDYREMFSLFLWLAFLTLGGELLLKLLIIRFMPE